MNTNAYPSSSYPQSQQNINPAMLSRAGGGGYNSNMGMMPNNNMNMNMNMMGGQGINPAQLMNGMGNQSMTLNPAPAQLLHQQQSQMMMNGGMGMGGMGGGGMGGMSGMGSGMGGMGGMGMGGGNMMNMGSGGAINPASLSASPSNINPGMVQHQPQAQLQHPQMGNMGGMNMGMNANPPMNHMGGSGGGGGLNAVAVLNGMGITREQLAAMPQQERQMKIAVAMQTANAMGFSGGPVSAGAGERQHPQHPQHPQQHPQHQHGGQISPQNAAFFDRPSSSASSHSHSHSQQQPGMMPPPPPRPPTAQGMHPSRPGTAMSHHSPTIPGPQIAAMGGAIGPGGQRPPSRVASASGSDFAQQNMFNAQNNVSMNGYANVKPASTPTPQPQQPRTPQPYQQQQHQQHHGGQGSPPPMPGSPYRGTQNLPGQKKKMGESPRIGGAIGLPPQQPQQQQQHLQGAPMGPPGLPRTVSAEGLPMTSPGAGGMNGFPMQQAQRQSPRPTSSMGMVGGMGIGGEMQRPAPPQRQRSMPPPQMQQPPGPGTPMRQGSLPPPQMQMQKEMNLRMSVPPPGTPSAVGAPGAPPVQAPNVPAPPVIASSSSSSSASGAAVSPAAAGAGTAQSQNGPVIPQLPPLPANVSLNPSVTRVTPVPLIDSLKHIPPLSETEIKDVQGWMKVDKEYEGVFRKMKERMGEEMREAFGMQNAAWWQKGYPGGNWNRYRRGREPFDVRYPKRRGEPGSSRKKPGRREGLRLPRKIDPTAANLPEQLVPIRLEFDVEHHKMRDTFIWNLNDPIVTPELFAQSIVEDYALASSYHSVIVKHIQDQLSDYKAHSVNYDGEGGEYFAASGENEVIFTGTLDDEESEWWERWRKRVRTEADGVGARRKRRKMVKEEVEEKKVKVEFEEGVGGETTEAEDDKDKVMAIEDFRIDEEKLHEEMRIVIKLDIIVGSMKLDDQFEWDLDNPDASPEQFAAVYTQELGVMMSY